MMSALCATPRGKDVPKTFDDNGRDIPSNFEPRRYGRRPKSDVGEPLIANPARPAASNSTKNASLDIPFDKLEIAVSEEKVSDDIVSDDKGSATILPDIKPYTPSTGGASQK